MNLEEKSISAQWSAMEWHKIVVVMRWRGTQSNRGLCGIYPVGS